MSAKLVKAVFTSGVCVLLVLASYFAGWYSGYSDALKGLNPGYFFPDANPRYTP